MMFLKISIVLKSSLIGESSVKLNTELDIVDEGSILKFVTSMIKEYISMAVEGNWRLKRGKWTMIYSTFIIPQRYCSDADLNT